MQDMKTRPTMENMQRGRELECSVVTDVSLLKSFLLEHRELGQKRGKKIDRARELKYTKETAFHTQQDKTKYLQTHKESGTQLVGGPAAER